MTDKNYYEILGVGKDASQADIKKAFRTAASEHHPDHGGDEDRFKELNEAYSVLSDENKRAEYDNPARMGGHPFNFADIFSGNFGRSMRPGPRRQTNNPVRGADLNFVVDVPLSKFIFGGTVEFNAGFNEACQSCNSKGYTDAIPCENCGGSGHVMEVKTSQGVYMQSVNTCPDCHGRGEKANTVCDVCGGSGENKVTDKKIEMPIVVGVRDGQVITQQGSGRLGINGGGRGNINVKLRMILPLEKDLTEEQKKVLMDL